MRTMLDELMGKERNLPPEERTGKGISYKDAAICKYSLAGLCPYGLFKNTKSDLGNVPFLTSSLISLLHLLCDQIYAHSWSSHTDGEAAKAELISRA